MNIVVLGGGDSPEREVSLRSAKAVSTAAREAGYDVEEHDPANGLEFLDMLPKDSLILPILHGAGGEDGTIQAELEKRNLPFLGCDAAVSAVCFDKVKAREVLARADLPVAAGAAVTSNTYWDHGLAAQPHVLKASHGGSSIGTLIVRDVTARTRQQVLDVFDLDRQAVIEELVDGIEVTVPILGNEALPVIEIKPPVGAEFDYENKYNGATQELCPPVSIDVSAQHYAQDLALKAHQALGCRHLSRVDIIIRPNGQAVILEVNTLPGMTNQSLFPKSAAAAGLAFPQLITRFVELITATKS